MTLKELEAIRARDAEHGEDAMWVWAYSDRRALLALVRELAAAAGRVTCERCGDFGTVVPDDTDGCGPDDMDPCPDCTPLRELLEAVSPAAPAPGRGKGGDAP